MLYSDKYNEWLDSKYIDKADKEELMDLKENFKEIEDRFYKNLEFGTGGIRGIIGIGTNRINKYIIRMVTQGFSNQIKKENKSNYKIVISYDNRKKSNEFAKEAALVMAANGIKAYIFSELRSTPELSFAVRELKADGGIMITASHNPHEYNGYKVYGDDGCQIVGEYANSLVDEVGKVSNFDMINYIDEKEAIKENLLEYIGENIDKKYIDMVKSISMRKELFKENIGDFKVIYSPLHGTGAMPVTRTMKELGFLNLLTVKEQMTEDENFSTVDFPNPEDINAFKLGIDYGVGENGDLIIATDPDCDRVGVVVRDKYGAYIPLTGNQTGVLLMDYILNSYKDISKNTAVVATIVTSALGKSIAQKYGVNYFQTLTGFKYIGEKIKEFEHTEDDFIFGYEESYGYLSGTAVRDKDAVIASMLIIEMALFYNSKGLNLIEKLEELFKEYGYYVEDLYSLTLKGKEGLEKINRTMETLRNDPLEIIASYKVNKIMDCNFPEKTGLPKSNVLKYFLGNQGWVAIRPSGTEPKLKIYFSMKGSSTEEARRKLKEVKEYMIHLIN